MVMVSLATSMNALASNFRACENSDLKISITRDLDSHFLILEPKHQGEPLLSLVYRTTEGESTVYSTQLNDLTLSILPSGQGSLQYEGYTSSFKCK